MSNHIIVADYNGLSVSFTDEGWFNATAGRRVDHYLANAETKAYIAALTEESNTRNSGYFMETRRGKGGGTWLHPDLAVHFARWLDVKFSIWRDRQIRALITGAHPFHDQKRLRHEAAASYKVMSQILQESRLAEGKESAPHHFMTEAKLVNFGVSGKFQSLDRDALSVEELDLLARLEVRNTVMIARNMPYEKRKAVIKACSDAWRADRPKLQAA